MNSPRPKTPGPPPPRKRIRRRTTLDPASETYLAVAGPRNSRLRLLTCLNTLAASCDSCGFRTQTKQLFSTTISALTWGGDVDRCASSADSCLSLDLRMYSIGHAHACPACAFWIPLPLIARDDLAVRPKRSGSVRWPSHAIRAVGCGTLARIERLQQVVFTRHFL